MKLIEQIWKFLQKIIGFFKKIAETGITFLKIVIENGYRIKSKKHNKDENFIVLANGPSLNEDLKNLKPIFKNNNLVVANQFSLSEAFKELKPKYYILLDGQYFTDIIALQILEDNLQLLTHEVNWDMNLYIPSRFKNSYFVNTVKTNPNITIQLFNISLAKGGFESINWRLFDNNLAMLQSQNVIISALFNLIKDDAKNIYLFGAQNDWHLNAVVGKDNLVYIKQPHFYADGIYKIHYKNIPDKIPSKLHELLESSAKAIKGYHPVQAYAKHKNCNIYNCSKNSFIDAFPRLTDEEFIKKVSK